MNYYEITYDGFINALKLEANVAKKYPRLFTLINNNIFHGGLLFFIKNLLDYSSFIELCFNKYYMKKTQKDINVLKVKNIFDEILNENNHNNNATAS